MSEVKPNCTLLLKSQDQKRIDKAVAIFEQFIKLWIMN